MQFIEHQRANEQQQRGEHCAFARGACERETWHRATTSKRWARMSTSFPFPSSPHCVPSTPATWLSDSSRPRAAADGSSVVAGATGAALTGRHRRGAGPGTSTRPPQPAPGRMREKGAGSSDRGASGMAWRWRGAGGGRRGRN